MGRASLTQHFQVQSGEVAVVLTMSAYRRPPVTAKAGDAAARSNVFQGLWEGLQLGVKVALATWVGNRVSRAGSD